MLLMEKLIKLVSMMTRYGGPRAELYLKNSADGVLFLSGAEKRASRRKSVSRAGSSLSRSFSPEKNSHLSDLLALLLLSLATVLAAVSLGQHKRRGRRWLLLLWARSGARKTGGRGLGEWWDWGAARHEPLKLLRVQDPLHLGELPDFLGASHDDRSSLLCSACSCAGLLATARPAVAQASFFFRKCPPFFLEMLESIFFFFGHIDRIASVLTARSLRGASCSARKELAEAIRKAKARKQESELDRVAHKPSGPSRPRAQRSSRERERERRQR